MGRWSLRHGVAIRYAPSNIRAFWQHGSRWCRTGNPATPCHGCWSADHRQLQLLVEALAGQEIVDVHEDIALAQHARQPLRNVTSISPDIVTSIGVNILPAMVCPRSALQGRYQARQETATGLMRVGGAYSALPGQQSLRTQFASLPER